jgi:hypothetical protein
VHVQRDKRPTLYPHYERCVFIGYPEGYKGWKFYNLTTKRTLISEHADFNEHPANSQPTVNASNPPYAPPDLPGNVDDEPVAAPEVPPPQGELLDEDDDKPAPLQPAVVAAPVPPVTPPPRPHSPIGIGSCLPVRNQQKSRDWWKLSPAQLVDNVDDSDDDDEKQIQHRQKSASLQVQPIPGLLQMQCIGLTHRNGKQLPCWNWTLTRLMAHGFWCRALGTDY